LASPGGSVMNESTSESPERKGKEHGRVPPLTTDFADSGIEPSSLRTPDPQPSSTGWRWTLFYRKYRIAGWLLLLSAVGFAMAWIRYPHASEVRQLSTPGIVNIIVDTKSSNDKPLYSITRKASMTSITLTAFATPKTAGGQVEVRLYLPHGCTFKTAILLLAPMGGIFLVMQTR
jgi:hypothetical protein